MLAGFHPTSMSGVFGAAAAAAHLRGLDADRLNHAFGIAVSLASGTTEFASSGGMAKRIHAARAAEGGLMAAALAADGGLMAAALAAEGGLMAAALAAEGGLMAAALAAEGGLMAAALAAEGFEGARDGLAGRYGFCRIFTDDPQPQRLTEQLGERWMIDEVTVKPYPSCSDLHPMVQATSELVAMHTLTADDIDRITVHCTTKVCELNDIDGTASVMAAQYSAQFNIAAAVLADPADPATFDRERIADPALAALQAKVDALVPTPEFDATYAWKQGARVAVTLADGNVLERTVHGQNGSMHAPLTDAEVEQKFAVLTDGRLHPGIPELVRSLPGRPIGDLTHRLRST